MCNVRYMYTVHIQMYMNTCTCIHVYLATVYTSPQGWASSADSYSYSMFVQTYNLLFLMSVCVYMCFSKPLRLAVCVYMYIIPFCFHRGVARGGFRLPRNPPFRKKVGGVHTEKHQRQTYYSRACACKVSSWNLKLIVMRCNRHEIHRHSRIWGRSRDYFRRCACSATLARTDVFA